jgi:hypothetical protein
VEYDSVFGVQVPSVAVIYVSQPPDRDNDTVCCYHTSHHQQSARISVVPYSRFIKFDLRAGDIGADQNSVVERMLAMFCHIIIDKGGNFVYEYHALTIMSPYLGRRNFQLTSKCE